MSDTAQGKVGRMLSGLLKLAKLLRLCWPDGEPLIVGGVRVGTILPDGTLRLTADVTYKPFPRCSVCQQLIEPISDQQQPGGIEHQPEGGIDARV